MLHEFFKDEIKYRLKFIGKICCCDAGGVMPRLKSNFLLAISTMMLVSMGLLSQAAEPNKHSARSTADRTLKVRQQNGKAIFKANGCFDCHSIDGYGCTEGVSLSSVGLRRQREFIAAQLKDPEDHVARNKKAFNGEPNLMANPNLTAEERDLIVTYLQSLRKPVPKKGQKSKYYNQL